MKSSGRSLWGRARRARERLRWWRLRKSEAFRDFRIGIFCSLAILAGIIVYTTVAFTYSSWLAADAPPEPQAAAAAPSFSCPNIWPDEEVTPVPEPATLMLFGAGAAWLFLRRKGAAA